MTDFHLHVQNGSIANAVGFFEHTGTGITDIAFFGEQFGSTTALLNHTQPVGNESVVHLLTGDTFTADIPKRKFAVVARTVAAYFGLQQ